MEEKKFYRWVLGLSGGGVLFAGYLTLTRLLTGICPFKEPCPYFLGYPACWYGLAMFILLFVVSLLGVIGWYEGKRRLLALLFVSGVGIVFSGSFVIREIILAIQYGWPQYTLLLPTCAYGFVVYTALFILAHRQRTTNGMMEKNEQASLTQ